MTEPTGWATADPAISPFGYLGSHAVLSGAPFVSAPRPNFRALSKAWT
ncbi:hypothetical protein BJ970_001950 [Saccharopolyspora phatthalungensis]|uniref:Uncharacterized protein n=1 Tax=Saccharopolyspora phatthalungensis TaxID=664693 RepID=A0A840Q1M7_9PSEU|nr:hypothetical protein [Saccharopolyspora phatthalungensis]